MPAPTVITVDTEAITTAAPRGLVARASTLSSHRSSLVSCAITVEFALACDFLLAPLKQPGGE